MRGIIALFQLYSVFSYIGTEKYQKKRINDYAAFQLTLIPYGLMSLLNILCGLVTPTYPTVYMIDSTIMREAKGRGWTFDGTVGELCEYPEKAGGEEDTNVGFSVVMGEREEAVVRGEREEANESGEIRRKEKHYVGFKAIVGRRTAEMGSPAAVGAPADVRDEISISHEEVGKDFKKPLDLPRVLKFYWECKKDLCVIRWFLRKNLDPRREFVGNLLDQGQKDPDKTNIVISPIGNPTYQPTPSWLFYSRLIISDIIILASISLPYIITWKLTKYKAPTGGNKMHIIIFMLWLLIGQGAPLGRVGWEIAQTRLDPHTGRDMWYTISCVVTGLLSIPSIWGIILVGIEKYHHPDAATPYGQSR